MWEQDLRTGIVQWSRHIDDILGLPPGATSRRASTPCSAAIVPEERNEVEEACTARSISRRRSLPRRVPLPPARRARGAGPQRVERRVATTRAARAAPRRRPRRHPPAPRPGARSPDGPSSLELLYAVAACANEAETSEHALHTSLERICTFGGWPVGSVVPGLGRRARAELDAHDAWSAHRRCGRFDGAARRPCGGRAALRPWGMGAPGHRHARRQARVVGGHPQPACPCPRRSRRSPRGSGRRSIVPVLVGARDDGGDRALLRGPARRPTRR